MRNTRRRPLSKKPKVRKFLDTTLCRREGIAQSLYYKWSKEFLEAGKRRLSGDTERQATSSEVKELRREMSALKEALADVLLEHRWLTKSRIADGDDHE